MDPSRFDGLARSLAGFVSRRSALAALVGGLVAPVLGEADADARKRGKKQRRQRHQDRDRDRGRHKAAHRNQDQPGSSQVAAEKKKKKKKCKGGTIKCGKLCVNTAIDAANCGACGQVCAAGESCQNGACTCDGARCAGCCVGGVCRDGLSAQQCGSGGAACTACPGDQVCSGGVCDCPGDQAFCNGACTSLVDNTNHCGRCGVQCPSGTLCIGGACSCGGAGACSTVETCCAGACADLTSSSIHCGACGVVCLPGEVCSSGVCVCGSDSCSGSEECCTGICIVTASDFANCGACGQGCSTVSADTCANRQCSCGGGSACDNGETCCSGDCADLRRSPNHCGQCGRTCRSTESCCISTCTDVSSDRDNCGACDAACDREIADTCSDGACRCGINAPCAAGLTCCAGECYNLQSNPLRCGSCSHVCPGAGAPGALVTCDAGICAFACQGNRWDVDGNPATGCEATNPHTGFDKDHAQDMGSRACQNLLTINGTMFADTRQHGSSLPGFNPATGSVPQWYRVKSIGGLLGIPCGLPPTYKLTMNGGASGCYQLTMIVGNGLPVTVPVVNGVAAMLLLINLQNGQTAYFGVEKICAQAISEAVTYQLEIML